MNESDPLAPARGCLFGLAIGTVAWVVALTVTLLAAAVVVQGWRP